MADRETGSSPGQAGLSFPEYVSMLSASALIHLGKLAGPVTGKIERDMEAARAMIDILVLLQDKTKGNLSDDEAGYLKNTVSTLQLNFVQEAEKDRKGSPEPAEVPKT